MEKIILRKASVDDAAALLEIYSYYVENTAITFEWEVPSLEDFRERIKNTLRGFPYIVAEREVCAEAGAEDGAEARGREILGYAYASAFKARAAYAWSVESSIYVKNTCRQAGIGRQLLQELENCLRKQNYLNINACIACAGKDKNDPYITDASIRFHEKMGYRLVGEFTDCGFKFKRWYNMVWMEKMLGEHNSEPAAIIKSF